MLITPELLYAYNHIHADMEDAAQAALVWVHIGTACQLINDYVGFDTDEVALPHSRYTAAERAIFQATALRIATLLQMECGGNIGVNSSASDMGASRSYLNVTDYTQYLKPLAPFRRNGGVW